jgi:uncharacterized protein YfaS (alpha-2-macroglobulin family)/tetratricopeptide (TPR) repeat protein
MDIMMMRFISAATAGLLFLTFHVSAASADFESLKADAEKQYADGSYALAHETYAKAPLDDLSLPDKRWVQFRLADTQWRSQAGTQTADTTKLDEARHQLEVLIRDITRVEEHDRIWAEVHESLADFFWTRRNSNNYGEAWPHYQQALDWWAGAADIELARHRYMRMVWTMARPPGIERYYVYGSWGNFIQADILENALKVSQTDNDKAHAHYLLAMTYRQQGDQDQRARVPDEFEGALKLGQKTDWYDDALYNYAEWMVSYGNIIPLAEGGWRQEPNYVKALELFRRLVKEFSKGETRYWEQAQQQIKNITEVQLGVSVQNIFLPDSEIQYYVNWRNVKRIDLALYPVELNRDVNLHDDQGWLHSIKTSGLEKIKSWSRETADAGDYKPGSDTLHLDGKLKPGAYVLEANGGGKSSRDLVLVTDATLLLKASGKQALVYFCNALEGEPLGGAKIKLWERWHDGNRVQVRESEKSADKDGIAVFDLTQRPNSGVELFASAILKDRQAFAPGNSYWSSIQGEPWKIYAFTDRPAYRPKETVQWKFVARRYNGSVYSTPSEQTVEFQITDPRGAKVKEDKVSLNAFGSAWSSLDLTEAMPLGEYHVTFWDSGKKSQIGSATLFRLEEYKLPEFKVSVQTPEETGKKKTFRVGEKVEVNVQADYYFGGPVANANVEVVVYQNPFYHYWHRPHDYPWFYEDMNPESRWGRYYGGGQIIKRETLKTDATGKASLTFETPRNAGQDFDYRVEARVTDSSRREIVGNGNVRVTRQRYYVYAEAAHNLFRPQDKVNVEFKALDANEQPVETEGTVKVTRDYWYEIWLDPDGKEFKGEELKRLRARLPIFPPLPATNRLGWRLKFQGYEHDDILTKTLKTDTNGVAELTFTPEREGYYRVAWASKDSSANAKLAAANYQPSITAETTVWVATGATTDLGYRHGGLEIIVDKDTFRAGQKAPVMLVAPTHDRHILFTVEGEDLYNYQLIHLDGPVKLIELPIEEKHVPNIFLSAAMVNDRQIFTDTKQVVIPPVRNFLTVDVKPDRPQYQPREEGTFHITTRDDTGQTVSAEVSFGLVDESVFYIQQDYAGDPRQFYFGTKRPHSIQTQSTMNQKRYAKLVPGEKEQLIDEFDLQRAQGSLDYDGNRRDYYYAKDKVDALSELSATRSFTGGLKREELSLRQRPAGAAGLTVLADAKTLNAPAPAAVPAEQPPGQEPAVQVRSDFRSTILWQPDVITDKDGHATVKVKYPDSLTGWKATARACSQVNQFGIDNETTRTKQPLIVRLQAPRFFLVGDTITLSAVINNNTDENMNVKIALDYAGGLSLDQSANSTQSKTISVPANGEARADWLAQVKSPGEVKLKVTGRGGKYSDAMEKSYPIFEHGIEKFITKSGKARGNDIAIKLDLPRERKAETTALVVQLTPSMAVTMLDALPYLIDYPYGCTEQTMSRFLPAAITAKTLRDLGLQPEDVMGRVFGGIETGSAAATHPNGKKDLEKLNGMVKAGLERLYDFQHSDGGWGWWKQGESDHWMTAYVVWGLTLARDAEVKIDQNVLSRGATFLDKTLVEEEENPDMQAWMLHALAVYKASNKQSSLSKFESKAFDNLWTNRDKLNAYTRALLALSAHYFGKGDQAKTLIQNLENGVKRDERPDTSVIVDATSAPDPQRSVLGTAHWGEDGVYWRWSDGGVEATAFALRALLTIDPQNKLIEPVTNWLIKNRRGAQWNSTRDTAIVVLAMNDYLRTSGELKPELEYELLVNGSSVAKKKISGADVFNAPSRFAIDAKLIKDANEIRIKRKSGSGPIYFAAEAKFFSLEEPIAPAANEIFVKREYYKLAGRPTLLKGYVYDKEPLKDGETVKSGERVETLITIEAKNNYEYLIFEDLKPAGLEAVEVRSGESLYARELKSGAVEHKFASTKEVGRGVPTAPEHATPGRPRVMDKSGVMARQASIRPVPQADDNDYTGRSRWVYQELRDRKVALFIDKLPEGVWEIRYDLRAEVPGKFHALPVTGQAMYVPEIRCNGAEVRINVVDSDRLD